MHTIGMHAALKCISTRSVGRSYAPIRLVWLSIWARNLSQSSTRWRHNAELRLYEDHDKYQNKAKERFSFVEGGLRVSEKDSRVDAFTNALVALDQAGHELRKLKTHEALGVTEQRLVDLREEFRQEIAQAFSNAAKYGSLHTDSLVEQLVLAHNGEYDYPLRFVIKIEFFKRIMRDMFTPEQLSYQEKMVDFRYPQEWFPKARYMKRKIHLHVGPTNSGKTYQALKRLEQVEGLGTYMGPLRLLAHEIFSRMNNRGVPTFLITGDERQPPTIPVDDSTTSRIISCTVEMANMSSEHDIAVIDEIQMIADEERGFAWSIALIGIPAKEIHLCGEERAVPIIETLAKSLGEELIIHRYQRLSPLEISSESLGDFNNLEKGDCIVCFSIAYIHTLRRHIERVTKRKVAVVYGKLPSEIRLQQAELFNDPDNDYDFLVASNAIGMGLNLAIKRVIFWSTAKPSSGGSSQSLTISETRQIGGRAGRYRISSQDQSSVSELKSVDASQAIDTSSQTSVGYVTAMQQRDLELVRERMLAEPEPINTAGIFPTNDMIERFYSIFPPGFPFSFVLVRLIDLAKVSTLFYLTNIRNMVELALAIDSVQDLPLADRITLCTAPHSARSAENRPLIVELATCVAKGQGGHLLELKNLHLELLDVEATASKEQLRELEELHKALVLYNWLSYRFPGAFPSRPMAEQAKRLTYEHIQAVLEHLDATKLVQRSMKPALGTSPPRRVLSKPNLIRRHNGSGYLLKLDIGHQNNAPKTVINYKNAGDVKIRRDETGSSLASSSKHLRSPSIIRRVSRSPKAHYDILQHDSYDYPKLRTRPETRKGELLVQREDPDHGGSVAEFPSFLNKAEESAKDDHEKKEVEDTLEKLLGLSKVSEAKEIQSEDEKRDRA